MWARSPGVRVLNEEGFLLKVLVGKKRNHLSNFPEKFLGQNWYFIEVLGETPLGQIQEAPFGGLQGGPVYPRFTAKKASIPQFWLNRLPRLFPPSGKQPRSKRSFFYKFFPPFAFHYLGPKGGILKILLNLSGIHNFLVSQGPNWVFFPLRSFNGRLLLVQRSLVVFPLK